MKLLIVTQKVNMDDQILGFFHRWTLEFSKNVESILVICLEKGEYDLPENVEVLSLGKEEGKSRISYIFRFFKYIWVRRKDYDSVFVHMNQIYVILGAFVWKVLGKKISLWYAHGSVSFSLRVSTLLSDIVLTSSKKGFRINTKKVHIVGQGIDTNLFKPSDEKKDKTILTVGRISKSKNVDLMIEVIDRMKDYKLQIIGDPVTEGDKKYFKELKKDITNRVEFVGSLPQAELVPYYNSAGIFLNLSDTGSMDKVVLEAMSVGLPVVTANEAYSDIIPSQYIKELDTEEISKKIDNLYQLGRSDANREYVVKNHSLEKLIPKIMFEIENV